MSPLLLSLLACRAQGPDVVLVVVDTLRRDHVGSYGSELSPELDALQPAVFEQAWAASSWTLPSTATLMTGLEPHEHGAASQSSGMREDVRTLAEHYERQGYTTCGVMANLLLKSDPQFRRGFEHWDASMARGPFPITTAEVLEAGRACLEEPGPHFLYLHHFDPHDIYRDHAELDYATLTGRVNGKNTAPELRALKEELLPEEIEALRQLYREEVRHSLDGTADFLASLPPETIWVLTADHGELLGEGDWGHARGLSQEEVAVPLLVRHPGLEGRIERSTGHADFVQAWMAGELAELPGRPEEPVFLQLEVAPAHEGDGRFPRRSLRGVVFEGHKQVLDLASGEQWRVRLEAPLERLPPDPALSELLSTRAGPLPEAVELDAERLEALKALGYLEE